MTNYRFLGIDPGIKETGWAIVEQIANARYTVIDSGIIKTSSDSDLGIRLLNIFRTLKTIIEINLPTHAAIEDTYVNIDNTSSLKLAQARAAAIIAITDLGIPYQNFPAKTIKKTITGSGSADKEQMKKMLGYYLDELNIKNHNTIDAIAIAICLASHKKMS